MAKPLLDKSFSIKLKKKKKKKKHDSRQCRPLSISGLLAFKKFLYFITFLFKIVADENDNSFFLKLLKIMLSSYSS